MSKESGLVTIYVMGKPYEVPGDLTIMTAMEYAGFQLRRGVGCREGFCGACATVYRLPGDYKLRGGLACQTVVQPDMYLAQIPFTPAVKPGYDLEELKAEVSTFLKLYPEIFRCLSCNTCSKACPQDITVMDYVQALVRGDIAKAADISFDCIACGLCAMRCPAEIVQFNAGLLARRLYSRYLAPRHESLRNRVKETGEGKYDAEIDKMAKMPKDELKKVYAARELILD
jgi:heterodisulfide reductase subunit C